MSKWSFQPAAVSAVKDAWRDVQAVCLAAPTGSGKTNMGVGCIAGDKAIWVGHTRVLVDQAARVLRARYGESAVGLIMGGEPMNHTARYHVATIQSLLACGRIAGVDTIVLDEAHHYVAKEWRQALALYPHARVLGLTAWPERRDGTPLGDIFRRLVVAAKTTELIRSGVLVDVRLHAPRKSLGHNLAMSPVKAYAAFSEGARTIMYCPRVADAERWAQEFLSAGIPAASLSERTNVQERARVLDAYRVGRIKVITNVALFIEGLDVPETRCVMLATGVRYEGVYLQMVGRALRQTDQKPDAIVIDLVGATVDNRLGLPTADRVCSLDGKSNAEDVVDPDGRQRLINRGDGSSESTPREFSQRVYDYDLVTVLRGALPTGVDAPEAIQPDFAAVRAELKRRRTQAFLSGKSLADRQKITGSAATQGAGR